MRRALLTLLTTLMALFLCPTVFADGKRVAKDEAQMQTEDPSLPTRLPQENGTRILMHFGDTVIPGILNDSETARALIEKLPYTQHMSRYSHDFCGVTESLPYNEEEEHFGWLNGDIDYATDAPYFTILFEDQDDSEVYGNQVNIGVIDCPLEEIAALEGSFDVLIELDESIEKEGEAKMKAKEKGQLQLTIGETPVTVDWEENESVAALRELAKEGLTIQMSMYGGFEQVGSLPQTLPSSDHQTTTSSGDIALYSSSQLVVFYGENSWAYTRLGHITDQTKQEMKELLGAGDVTLTLSVQ